MGVSIYYLAIRARRLSEADNLEIGKLLNQYSHKRWIEEAHQTDVGWNGDDFSLCDPPFDLPETILQGATKLPDNSEDLFWMTIQHWCRLLTEIRRLVPDAIWRVHVDDSDIY